ncbi:MAG: hypothetical protein WBX15_04175 [Thermoanaerobaculia bacterium]
MKWLATVAVIALLSTPNVQAADPQGGSLSASPGEVATEPILVPVAAQGLRGANGSVWDTDLWVTNTTDSPIVFYFSPCQVSCCCDEFNTFAPQQTRLGGGDSSRGAWFYLPADGSLQMQARLRDRTRAASSAGVELPLVRERDFRTGVVQLVGVPQDGRFRVMLRIYALAAGVSARIEQLDANGVVQREDIVALEPPTTSPYLIGVAPAYAQLPLPVVAPNSEPGRIRISSLSPGEPIWTFASITNNESGEVTLVQPWW